MKKITVKMKNLPTQRCVSLFTSNLQSSLFTFFSLWGNGGGLSRPPGGDHSCNTSRSPLSRVLYVGKNIYLWRMSEEKSSPYVGAYMKEELDT